MRLFHDPDGGGFFTTGTDAEQLVVRLKDVFDDATPSANSLAANGLLRLAALTGETDARGAGARGAAHARARRGRRTRTASRICSRAIERYVTSPVEIAIVGDPRRRTHAGAAARGHDAARPRVGDAHRVAGDDASPLLAGRDARDGVPTAYVCEHYTCRQPVTEPRELRAQLDAVAGASRQQAAR